MIPPCARIRWRCMLGPQTSPAFPSPGAGAPRPVELGERSSATPRALGPFFWLAARAPAVVSMLQPLAARLVPIVSRKVHDQTRRNAARIFGKRLTPVEQVRFTRRVVEN